MLRKILVVTAPLGVVVLTFLALGVMRAAAPEVERKEPEERRLTVTVARAERTTILPRVVTQGEVQARTEIDLIPQVSGRIQELSPSFAVGAAFATGDVLIRIEDTDYELAVVRARARVAQAQQVLDRESAQADMARQDWEELGRGEASPLTLREPQLAEAKANLEAADADLRTAELDLERTRITAPFDGRVRSKNADVGQFVSVGTNLGRIFATDVVEIALPLNDRELGLIGLPIGFVAPEGDGLPVEFTAIVAGEMRTWEGRIVRTNSAIDTATRVLSVIAQVNDPYGAAADDGVPLAVGLFVTAEIRGKPILDVIAVPREAIRDDEFVYVVKEDGSIDIRRVRPGFAERNQVIIQDGLEAGEAVVISALQGVTASLRVNIQDADGEAPGSIDPDTGSGVEPDQQGDQTL